MVGVPTPLGDSNLAVWFTEKSCGAGGASWAVADDGATETKKIQTKIMREKSRLIAHLRRNQPVDASYPLVAFR